MISTDLPTYRILIVDDDKDILDLLKYNLEKDGYVVKGELNAVNSIDTALNFHPDLIILDFMMPRINGLEVCKRLREIPDFKSTYIFFLTAKSDISLQLQALSTGGDDFIDKITGLRALTHKVGTVLKKNLVIRKSIKEITLGDLSLDRLSYAVYYKGKKIELPKYEFELLYFFAQNPQKIITQKNLLHNIWGSEIYLFAKSVDTYINNISQKLGESVIKKLNEREYCFNYY